MRAVKRILPLLVAWRALIALFYAEEDWRGKRAWEKLRREGEAKGEHFDRESFIPPPIPDDQNFAAMPLISAMFDYQYDPAKKADWLFLTDAAKWRDDAAYQRTQQLSVLRPRWRQPAVPGSVASGQGV